MLSILRFFPGIGDMLQRMAFWGERSVADVEIADATAQFLFPS